MACDCIKKTNELLQAHNAALVTNILSTPKAFVETYVRVPKRGAKAPKILATYCPLRREIRRSESRERILTIQRME